MFGKYVASAGFVRIIINHGHSEAAAGACAASLGHPSIQRRSLSGPHVGGWTFVHRISVPCLGIWVRGIRLLFGVIGVRR